MEILVSVNGTRFGEDMTEELRDSVEKRIANTLETITAEVFANRIGIVRMCNGI